MGICSQDHTCSLWSKCSAILSMVSRLGVLAFLHVHHISTIPRTGSRGWIGVIRNSLENLQYRTEVIRAPSHCLVVLLPSGPKLQVWIEGTLCCCLSSKLPGPKGPLHRLEQNAFFRTCLQSRISSASADIVLLSSFNMVRCLEWGLSDYDKLELSSRRSVPNTMARCLS